MRDNHGDMKTCSFEVACEASPGTIPKIHEQTNLAISSLEYTDGSQREPPFRAQPFCMFIAAKGNRRRL